LDTAVLGDLVRVATCEVFSTMLSLELEAAPPFVNPRPLSQGDVTAMIGIAGDQQGFVAILCTNLQAQELTARLLGMERDEVIRFVRDEALQDDQFAGNMWTRAITSSPQLTSYWLGYREVWGLYEDVRRARGEGFDLRAFMDGMMAMGPVPVRHYRAAMLP